MSIKISLKFYPLRVLIFLSVVSVTVQAHEFTVLIVSSFTGPEATIGKSVRDGFLVASAEQDGHPEETSNGHLGGLDVHLRNFNSTSSNFINDLKHRINQEDVDMVVVVQQESSSNKVFAKLKNMDVVLVSTRKLPFTGLPATAPTADKFVQDFRLRFSYEPDRFAAQGYQLARRIADAVRPFDSVADKSALRQRLESSLHSNILW